MTTIKNWKRFQHYQTGKHAEKKPDWIKLYRGLLDDIEWHELDPVAAKTLVSLWLLASENGGILPSLKTISFRLRMPEKQIKSVLSKLPHWIDDSLDSVYTASSLEEEEEKEKEVEREEEAPTRSNRSHQLPKSWAPTESHFLEGEKLGYSAPEIRAMAEEMQYWAWGKGELRKNWDMVFLGWMRRERKRAPPKLSRTQQAAHELLQEISSDGSSRRGICNEGGESTIIEFPKSAPRSQNFLAAASNSSGGAIKREPEGDG